MDVREDEGQGKAPAASVLPQGVEGALPAAAPALSAEPKGAHTHTASSTVSTGKRVDVRVHFESSVWCVVWEPLGALGNRVRAL
jgi:hypothetical protein